MKFAMAFSTGKDSMLALHKMVKEGHDPVGLMVMYNSNAERSWFHGTDKNMLEHISKSLEIPIYFGESDGNDYNEVFEATLQKIKDAGAEACVFGDIDLVQHKEWDEERCKAVGVKAVLPLWQINRETAVREVVAAGYKCMIKCVHEEQLPESFLGKVLSESVLEDMKEYGIDICGENGEFHTVVIDGPMFKYPLPYEAGKILKLQYVSAIELEEIKMEEAKLKAVKPNIDIDVLDKIDIRVGTIQQVNDIPKSDKLVKLTVDFGDFQRTILVGMKKERENPKEIEGKQALFVVNLAPRKMMGEISEGMLFDIGYDNGITPVLAQPEKPVANGVSAG